MAEGYWLYVPANLSSVGYQYMFTRLGIDDVGTGACEASRTSGCAAKPVDAVVKDEQSIHYVTYHLTDATRWIETTAREQLERRCRAEEDAVCASDHDQLRSPYQCVVINACQLHAIRVHVHGILKRSNRKPPV